MLIGGLGAANVFMKFNPANLGGATMPSVYISAAAGNQSAAICSASGGAVPGSAVCDLSGGNVTWIGNTLSLGTAGAASPSTAANGTLTFDNGNVTFNTITVGNQSTSAGAQGIGTINVGTNATLVAVNKITLGATTGTVNGSTAGTINVNTNGTLQASTITNGGAGSTINMTNANWVVTLSSTSATNIAVSSFNARGTTNIINITSITPLLGGPLPVRFHLISAASLNGASTLGVVFPTSYNPSFPYGGFLDYTTTPGLVDLVLTSAPPTARVLAWSGLNSGTPDGDWDVASTPDWLTNAVATIYNQFDFATFGDIASPAQTNINLTASLTPFNVTVSNNASLYTIGGGGNLSGATGLTKQGNGTLILDNNGSPNNFTGGVTISGGILQVGTNDANGNLPAVPVVNSAILVYDRTDNINVGNVISGGGTVVVAGGGTVQLSGANTFTGSVLATNNSTVQGGAVNSFGASNGAVIIANGSTLDADGQGTLKPITVAGTGVGGNGAITSGSGLIGDSTGGLTPTLTLSGDTTLSFPNRWDLGSSTGVTLSTGGHAYNLTLNGTANNTYFEWRDVHADASLANIDITAGSLGIAGSTTVGNSANSLTIESSAGLKFYNDDGFNASINKLVVLKDSGFIQNGAGASTMSGGLVITNANGGQYCDFNVGGTSLTVSGAVSGNGILYGQGGTSPLVINGNASAFTGGAQIYTGTFTVNNAFGSGISTQGGTSLSGTGTINGLVDVSGAFYPGAINGVGTFNAAAGLTLEMSATVTMDLGATTNAGGANNDLVVVTGDLTPNGNTISINAISGILASGTYELMTYTGNLNNSFGSVQTVSPSRYGLTLNTNTPHQVLLTVVGNPNNLVWNNNGNDALWNVQSSFDWTNLTTHAEDQFFASDSVTFDDTISTALHPATTISIAQTVFPSVITNNSSANSYTLAGGGKISGGASIVKSGSSTLTLKTTNDFTGNVTITGGTLKGGANGSMGATNGTIYVTNGGTLDIDFTLTAKPLVLSGDGVGSQGALVNNDSSGTAIFSSSPGLLNVTLAGNTTIGGANRTDFGQNSTLGATLSTGGNNYNLTILGNTYRQWDNVALDANFGNINVSQGTLGIVGTTTLGNATNTLTVLSNATLEFFIDNGNLINVTLNKSLQLNNTATLQNGGGTNVILSSVVLGAVNGDVVTNNVGGTALTMSNVISGPGAMIKVGSSPLILAGTNTYTGSTVLSAGTIALTNNGSISGSTNINLASGTILDASGRGDKTLTLGSGQTIDGTGTVRGSMTASSGSIVAPGLSGAGTLTVTNVATLQGTTAMGIGAGSNNLLSANSLSYGGTLKLSFTGSLAQGNTFKLFNASSYSGSFSSITPSTPGAGLSWDQSQLTVSGTLGVISSAPPEIGKITVSGTSLTITGSGGTPNGTYHVWGSTNVTTPLTNWLVIGSGSFDSSGNFTNNGTITPGVPHSFYLIVEP